MLSEKRYFKDSSFISEALPEISIRLPETMTYVGQTDFVLKEKARIDRHHFLETDVADTFSRLVILHFEHFLPTNDSIITYRPPEPPRHAGPNYRFTLEPVRLGKHDYIHNTWFFDAAMAVHDEPDKELAQTARLLQQNGYILPDEIRLSRYVRILDATRKSELILFYMEPLAPTGFTLADFVEGGAGAAVYNILSAEITTRSTAVFQIERG
ncbi:MAG: hypothetical protein H6667_25835 [Ardenticatenaceae bacterium]|nr:hypothetical protein [Ardenticatenaceae bacterium]MCB9445483.1 hypothetical protein [Ardenticatenaceae bacterium]